MLEKINEPNDIKNISPNDYKKLAKEIRGFLLNHISKTGGHLASNLGIVELTMAIHLAMDFPKDQLIFDVGHQSYVHKILTGRKDGFKNLRQFGGMSGFPKPKESVCDAFHSGHSSMSLSVALGMAQGRNIKESDETIIAVIGDGALTGGMAYEALNNMARLREEKKNMIIILNDNKMSISENVGGISGYLNKIRIQKNYVDFKDNLEKSLNKMSTVGSKVVNVLKKSKNSIKQFFVPGMFFEDMGITYIGPIDGHNIKEIYDTIVKAKQLNEPIIIHVITKKGKGYKPAQLHPEKFHGVGPFSLKDTVKSKQSNKTNTDIFSQELVKQAHKDKRIVAVTAAMPEGTGLSLFKEEFPNRFFDVGIAEEHGVTFCAGMAAKDMKPVFAVYSTFLQRGFDQVLHDVSIGNYPVIFGVDRSGLVGADGETHHGIFDISYLSMIPNLTVMAPINGKEIKHMLDFALASKNLGPVAIKYSRGEASHTFEDICQPVEYGKGQILCEGKDIMFVPVGNMLDECVGAKEKLEKEGYQVGITNPRFLKPLDQQLLDKIGQNNSLIVTVEENVLAGGFGSQVMQYYAEMKSPIKVKNIGIKDQFVEHGSILELRHKLEIDSEGIYSSVKRFLEE